MSREGWSRSTVRGDHELNEIKAEHLPQVAEPLTMASDEEVRAAVGAGFGSLGPVGFARCRSSSIAASL